MAFDFTEEIHFWSPNYESFQQQDWEKLDGIDWVELLRDKPQFAEHCNWEKLNGGNWVELLAAKPKFADKCKLGRFLGKAEFDLLITRPQLFYFFKTDEFTTSDWIFLLSKSIEIASLCPWKDFSRMDIMNIFVYQTEFDTHSDYLATFCDFSKLQDNDWNKILQKHPDFSKFRNKK